MAKLDFRQKYDDFGQKSDDSVHRILKSKWHRSLHQEKSYLRCSGESGTASVRGTQVYEQRSIRWTAHTTTMRERSRRTFPKPNYS